MKEKNKQAWSINGDLFFSVFINFGFYLFQLWMFMSEKIFSLFFSIWSVDQKSEKVEHLSLILEEVKTVIWNTVAENTSLQRLFMIALILRCRC